MTPEQQLSVRLDNIIFSISVTKQKDAMMVLLAERVKGYRDRAEMLELRIRQMVGSNSDDWKYYQNSCKQALRVLESPSTTLNTPLREANQ